MFERKKGDWRECIKLLEKGGRRKGIEINILEWTKEYETYGSISN